jgi:hypothetical protein
VRGDCGRLAFFVRIKQQSDTYILACGQRCRSHDVAKLDYAGLRPSILGLQRQFTLLNARCPPRTMIRLIDGALMTREHIHLLLLDNFPTTITSHHGIRALEVRVKCVPITAQSAASVVSSTCTLSPMFPTPRIPPQTRACALSFREPSREGMVLDMGDGRTCPLIGQRTSFNHKWSQPAHR